jgi:uncharacterized membrane protein YuzA (DUF378 family)
MIGIIQRERRDLNVNTVILCGKETITTRVIWKVNGLAAVRRCYAEGGSDC